LLGDNEPVPMSIKEIVDYNPCKKGKTLHPHQVERLALF
jgi:hypothetical protein